MTDLFSSEQVRLRALEPEDLDFLYLWENDAELRESGNTLVPIGRNRLKEYIEKSSEGLMELGMMRLVICLSDDDKPIGAIDLYEYDAFHRRVAVGLFVIPEYRRLGIAVESLRKISHYVLDYLRLHQIIAYVKQEIMSENNECKKQHVNEISKFHLVAKPVVKKKKKETSNTSLYVILALLLLLLGVGIFYYFYYDRLSYEEFNSTTQHTQTTDDSFLLPGDSAAVQESEKSENVDTSGVTASGTNESTATSPVASTSSTRKEQTASTASTSSKKTTPQQTKPATDTSTSSDHNVMARVKVASGERLTLLAQKYYGNKVFWVYIYDFNKAKIPDPDRVPAGMEILIPAKEVYAINAQSSASIAQAKELQSKIMANKTK